MLYLLRKGLWKPDLLDEKGQYSLMCVLLLPPILLLLPLFPLLLPLFPLLLPPIPLFPLLLPLFPLLLPPIPEGVIGIKPRGDTRKKQRTI